MGNAVSRAEFLRGDFSGRSRPLRPPWAWPESGFVARCTRCGDCIGACAGDILKAGRGGFPCVDFSRGECTFCGDCVRACAAGAFAVPAQELQRHVPWTARAALGDGCLGRRGVECRSCADHCPTAAIRFRLAAGGVAAPLLDASACTGCGACFAICPVQAIGIHATSTAREIPV